MPHILEGIKNFIPCMKTPLSGESIAGLVHWSEILVMFNVSMSPKEEESRKILFSGKNLFF